MITARNYFSRLAIPGVAFAASLAAAPLKVDFSIPGRSDSVSPFHEVWQLADGNSDRRTFDGITVTVTKTGPAGKGLRATWWKGGAVDGARLVADGITVDGADAGGQFELRLRGLAPGRHTLATFHNVSGQGSAPALEPIDISVDGERKVAGLVPTFGVAHDDDARTAYLEFEAREARDVVVSFRGTGAGLILCGFELDGSDPALRARKPLPAHGDEHADAEGGALGLDWMPAPMAVAHRVYFGLDEAAVAAATPDAPEYRGQQTAPGYRAAGVGVRGDYYWRIDELDATGRVTKGETWRFRARRLAFPEAEGYGRFARGGRGGRVIEVTNLNDSGPGSLRAAVEAEGPRTVVFAVSGLITLESKLVIKNPYLTIAGQTAPGKGIAIRKYTVGMSGTHDVIVRHLRVRPGNIAGVTLDGMGMASSDHSIIDHCSISWTIDEAFSSRGARNITLQRTLISEALNIAGHKKYEAGKQHGFAASIGGKIGSFHHNLLAHNSGRNWSLAGALDQATRHTGWLDIRNNVVYNWQNRTTDGGAAKVNYVANYYKPGPASKVFHLLDPERKLVAAFGPQDYYVEGNIMEGHVEADDALGGVTQPEPYKNFIVGAPFFPSHVATQSARAAYKVVLSDVGNNQPVLDAHDARVIRETLAGTVTYRGSKSGLPGLPDSQDDVGGWEEYPAERRAEEWDRDHDGMPDWWENLHGTDPLSPLGNYTESNADPDGDGFTRLEDYLNWMARPHVVSQRGADVEVDLSRYARGFTDRPVFTVAEAANGSVEVLPDGETARFNPAPGFAGLAGFTFTVTDAQGDAMTRTIGVLIR
ncbi:MAG TPA: Ig-like domain-containing protein [Opitutaceae bacterium]